MTRSELLNEAIALEAVGSAWEIRHAEAVTGYSESYLRNSSCPKHYEESEGRGTGKRRRVVFVPAEVRGWKQSLRKSA